MNELAEQLKNMTPLQRAVLALKETQARLDAMEQRRNEPIAIVGMACRFPGGANDPRAFWQLLCDGVDAICEIPADRWNIDDFYDPDPSARGKMISRCGGFLDRIDAFDNHFFGISENEAMRIDPQQRMLLELAWEALEDAGVPPTRVRATKVGVFVGISLSEYGIMLSTDLEQTNPFSGAGTSLCIAANRVSYALGLLGPSMAVDTACSSSIVALHLACQSIRNGECESALVGGANLLLSPIGTVNLTKAGFCAADGRVRAFDAAASGYVRSEGAGMVLLKPLSAALKNHDPIYAVVRGSAVNQCGASNGLTAPSRAAQEQVLREAYERARVSPSQVGYVETQGTGTRLGDAIEAMALGNVLGKNRDATNACVLGALKTNIGHTEAASGIASVIKAALVLKHRQIPANLHFHSPNPDIPFATLPFRMPKQLESWPDASHPRFAGVSAFGFGGSNSHVVLEEAPAPSAVDAASVPSGPHLLTLSARTEKALRDLAAQYYDFLRSQSPDWADVCYSAANHRDHHDCRLAVLADSREEAVDALGTFLTGEQPSNVFVGRKPFGRGLKVAFAFSGRAGDWNHLRLAQMRGAEELLAASAEVDAACQRVLGNSLERLLRDGVSASDTQREAAAALAIELALASWWRRAGLLPDIVLGQQGGEIASAAIAGILSTDEALQIVAFPHQSMPLKPRAASLPFLSTYDGKVHSGTDLDVPHWTRCRSANPAIHEVARTLASRNIDICLTLGSSSCAAWITEAANAQTLASVQLPPGGEPHALVATAMLYAAGADLTWERLGVTRGRYVRLPHYPWQRQKLWVNCKKAWLPSSTSETPRPAPENRDFDTTGLNSSATGLSNKRPDLTVPYEAARTPLEAAMVRSWEAILQMEGIGVHDNFFELGGDSLKATILLNRLENELGEVVPGHALFEVQCISDLADYLRCHCSAAVRKLYPDEEQLAGLTSETTPSAVSLDEPSDNSEGGEFIPRLERDEQAEELLARLDDLADDEVELLLGKVMTDDEVSHD